MDLLTKSIEKADFNAPEARREEINTWVAEITRNHIVDLIPQGLIEAYTMPPTSKDSRRINSTSKTHK